MIYKLTAKAMYKYYTRPKFAMIECGKHINLWGSIMINSERPIIELTRPRICGACSENQQFVRNCHHYRQIM